MNEAIDTGGVGRLKRCRHGYMLYNRHDLYIGQSLDRYGEWAEAELNLLGLLLHPGDVVIDVGANIGTHTVFFAQKVGPTGRVFAFEPQRVVFQMLCANVALGGHNNVHTINAGLSRQPGTLLLPALTYEREANYGNVRLSQTNDGESTAVMTLDQLPLERCRLLKIDVEGMELDVLEGGKTLIERTKPVLYVENNDPNKSPALIRHLLSLDYKLFWHLSRFYSPANFAGNADNVFGPLGDISVIAVVPAMASAFRALHRVEGPDDSWEAARSRMQTA